MRNIGLFLMVAAATLFNCGCSSTHDCRLCGTGLQPEATAFADDLDFLSRNVDVILLRDGDSAVAVVGAFQGRVMTSTFDIESGPSFGWINRDVISQGVLPPEERVGKLQDHIHVFGGEERFWLGPEGGQFSIYFEPGADFTFENWKTPAGIDTEAFEVVEKSDRAATFAHRCELVNWSGSELDIGIRRTVRILSQHDTADLLGFDLAGMELVAYETINTLINEGENEWNKETGMPSIWLLGMYPPSDGTTMAIPFETGPVEELGPKVNDAYFGKVPETHLIVGQDRLFMRGDGTLRAKIGISPRRSKGVAGSYDSDAGILNLVLYPLPDEELRYVNSMWELQDDPFDGDAINAYNDGSPGPGLDPLGPFYELETSSPAAALAPGESLTHIQTTIHLKGDKARLDEISRTVLGISIEEIESAF